MLRFFRTTLAGGILFLIPIVVVAVVIEKAFGLAHKIVAPLAAHLPFESMLGLQTPRVLAILLILLFCFAAGAITRTSRAQRVVDALESKVLFNLPGYELFKSIGQSTLGVAPEMGQEVVLIRELLRHADLQGRV
jgi:uncharacterized membrane protein